MQHSIRLAAGDMGRLKSIAGALGCLGTRQIGIGEPSVSEMLKQVASGDLVISRKGRTMATRNSKQEAEELLAKVQTDYPDNQFRLTDRSEPRVLSPMLIARNGWRIIEERSAPQWPLAMYPAFDVQQVEHCERCGTEVLTDAIGEADVYYCTACESAVRAEREVELKQGIEKSQAEIERYLDHQRYQEER